MLATKHYPQKVSSDFINFINENLVTKVDEFRQLQDVTGCVVRDIEKAKSLLEEMRLIVRTIYSELGFDELQQAFEADVDKWLARGLENPPSFDQSQTAYKPVADKQQTFFIGPVLVTNGPAPVGRLMECFLAQRVEPEIFLEIADKFPHPKKSLQSARILSGSAGFMIGNCLVFFPENIATDEKVIAQDFAIFFLNKFQRIYLSETMPRVRQVFGERDWASPKLSATDCYDAAGMWGYLHEYFHFQGPRPLDKNLHLKLKWYSGLLEELKCDCLTAYASYHTEGVPFALEMIEFVLFERMLRYTFQPDITKNFDGGSGLLLFQWLLDDGAIKTQADGSLQLDLESCVASMHHLVTTIESEIESTDDDEEYLKRAKAFVRKFLPKGEKGQYFSVPERFTQLINIAPNRELLSFENLPY